MFPEFGQAPLCLEFDLRTYEGPYYHVANFRGREGWLMAARGTIQNEHYLLSAKLIVACDEHENVILPFKAETLASCGWKNLTESAIEPPGILDDLMCEQEGDLYARFQRMMNRDLAGMEERAQRQIEAIDARLRASQRRLDRELSELRRRRLISESLEERMALTNLMTDIEADHDLATADLMAERARQRRRADAAEEMLWEDTDALIEVEPLFTINWRARHANCQIQNLWIHGGGISLRQKHAGDIRKLAEQRVKRELEARRSREGKPAEPVVAKARALLKKPPVAGKGRSINADKLPPRGADPVKVNAIMAELAQAPLTGARKAAADQDALKQLPKSTASVFGQDFLSKLKDRKPTSDNVTVVNELESEKAAPEIPPPSPTKPPLPKLTPAALDELARLQALRDKVQRRLDRLVARLASREMTEAIRGPLQERRSHYSASLAELDAEIDSISTGGPRPSLRKIVPMPKRPASGLNSERDHLVQQLALVVNEGAKFRQGSPKFAANLAERRELEHRIAALARPAADPTNKKDQRTPTPAQPEPRAQPQTVPAASIAVPPLATPPSGPTISPAPPQARTPEPEPAPKQQTALPNLRKIWLRKKANLDARVLDLEALKASHSPWTQPWFEVQDLLKKAQDELHLINHRLGVSSIPTPVAKPAAKPEVQELEVVPSTEPTPIVVLPPPQTDPRAKLLRRKNSIEAQIADLQEQEAKLPAWSKAWHAVRDRLAPLETELEAANEQLAKLPAVADSATQEPAKVSSLPEPLFGLTPQQHEVQPRPTAPLPKPPEDLSQLIARRDALKQELRDHERSGTSVEDGPNRMNVYRARRDKLMEQISRANMKIAMIERSASGTANGIAASPVSALLAWPPDRVDMLTRLWGEGHTASEIGKALGGVSRNAVISKAQRLGLPRRGQD